MIKILTAIGNNNLNNELKKYEEFNVIGNDILYSEGVIEILDNTDINYIILGEVFNEKTNYLVEKIKEINNKTKIIFIIKNKNKELENNLYKKGISDIFYEDENIDNLINYLKSKNIEYLNIELREEINNLKKIVLEGNNLKINNNKCVIEISGTRGIGKTTACVLFAKSLNKNNKILIIDYNFFNSQIGELYNKKINYTNINENDINNLIFNVDKNIDILIGLDVLYKYNKFDYLKFEKIIEQLKEKYNYIFVDKNIEKENEDAHGRLMCVDKFLVLSGVNKIDLNKTNSTINYLINNLKIEKNKINIIFYRINLFDFLRIIFNKKTFNKLFNFKILGIINNIFFIKKELTNENKLINKILIKKIIKKI